MPPELAELLRTLPRDVASTVWDFLDSHPNAIDLMVDVIVEQYPDLQ